MKRVVGPELATGAAPEKSAANFLETRLPLLGIPKEDLAPILSGTDQKKSVQPVMYDPKTGTYKYYLIRYAEEREKVPVFRSELRLLVRNAEGSPVVLAASTLKDLNTFVPMIKNQRISSASLSQIMRKVREQTDFQGIAAKEIKSKLTHFTEAQPIIWAGTEDAPSPPKTAVTYIGDNLSDPKTEKPERWLFVVDPETNKVLYKESQIVFEILDGQVSGMVTLGSKGMQCSEEVPTAFENARVLSQDGMEAFADMDGVFSIEAGDSGIVNSPVSGRWFVVSDAVGNNEVLSASGPGPISFMHNEADNDDLVIAQSNGFAAANQVRDFALRYNPQFPVIFDETDFPVTVNIEGGDCPGNAWYDYLSINFCRAGGGYANTAFAPIIHHEYGHHLVTSGGSGQDEYGEGMADVITMLIADDSGIGYGFYEDDCASPLRTADNDCQYDKDNCSTCGSEVHDCGMLLTGIVWSIRNELVQTEPEDYRELLSAVAVNSILLHTGSKIDDQVAVDFLTLDDNDGDINNGTPHREEICAGFEAHGISCPELKNFVSITVPEEATEGDGVLVGSGVAGLAWAIEDDLPVYVASSNMSEVEVYGPTVITAGSVSAPLDLTVKDDNLLDGTRRVRLTGLAPDMVQGNRYILVHDNETATLSVSIPADVTEGDTVEGIVNVDREVDADVSVALSSKDSSEIIVPSTVVIPAHETSGTFELQAVNDKIFDGDQSVDITAYVKNWTSGTTAISVIDDRNLYLEIPSHAKEGDSTLENAGTISLSASADSDLTVHLTSNDVNEIVVPETVTIKAGKNRATFDITIVDDAIIDGVKRVDITAEAESFVSASANMDVSDNDPGDVFFATDTFYVDEAKRTAEIAVSRNPSSAGAISVNYGTADLTATAGEDYAATAGTLTFLAGETEKTFTVPIIDDALSEGAEKVQLILSDPTDGGTIEERPQAILRIADDDITDYFTEYFDPWDRDDDTDTDADTDTGRDRNRGGIFAFAPTKDDIFNAANSDTVSEGNIFDLSYKTLTLTPDGSRNFYASCLTEATEFPVNPEGGVRLNLYDDSYEEVSTADGHAVSLYGEQYHRIYVCSNGFITFDWGDSAYQPEYTNHFSQPRVSVLHADFSPSQYADGDRDTDTAPNADGGMDTDENGDEAPISIKELDDRLVVTYDNVPQYNESDSNNFQVELFYNGVIRITWLRVDLTYGLVGLSSGEGIPPYFFESDISGYGACEEPGCKSDSECNDGLFCNGAERCIDKNCIGGTAPVCDDGITCTEDICDETQKACVSTPNNALCDDGGDCTEDFCSPEIGCVSETLPECCGNGTCESAENACACSLDCGAPAESEEGLCSDGSDNDCDGLVDGDDDDCACSANWTVCSNNTDCCSGICKGGFFKRCRPGAQCRQKGAGCATNRDCCSNQCRQYRFFKHCA